MTGNYLSLLQIIRERQRVSRAELAGLSGLSRPAVSAIIDKLLATGMICETGVGESNGGKPPVMISVVPGYAAAIGLDLGEENLIRGLVCDATGAIISEAAVPYENHFDDILAAVAGLVQTLQQKNADMVFKGIGVAVSGIVANDGREIIESSNFDITGNQLSDKFQEMCKLPVFLTNRSRTAAHAEKVCGNASDCADFVYLSIGKSIGCGIYHDDRLFPGRFNGAGEISTMLVPENGGMARLEEVIREAYLCDAFEQLTGQKINWDELCRAWHDNHPAAQTIFNKNAEQTAYAAAVTANLLNPQLVILGGRFKELGDSYLTLFAQHFNAGLTASFRGRIDVRLSRFGRSATALGAALKVIDKVFRFEL